MVTDCRPRMINLVVIGFVLVSLGVARADSNWPRFRGPEGTGHSSETSLPTQWDSKSVVWKIDLKSVGQSSPVIWGDRIFLTAATGDRSSVSRHLLCIGRAQGEVIWDRVIATGSGESIHKMNSWATPSCATDGKRVVAFFGNAGLHCYDFEGKQLWKHQLGAFPGSWGTGASPIIVGDTVIQNCDAAGKAFLMAVNKETGAELWRTPRRAKPRGGWSTPIVIDAGNRMELVLNGEFGVQSYNPETGKEYWFCKGFNGRGTPSPAVGHGLVYVVNGKPGDVYAVKPGGEGDVTKSQMAWHSPRGGGRDLPSPILVGDCLFVVNMGGIGTCYDAKSGKTLWRERLGGNFSSSPIAANGLIYASNEAGETFVVQPGKEFKLVSKNTIGDVSGEIFRASITPSGGQIFLRSDKALYCIGG